MRYAKLNILGQTKECRIYTKDEMLELIDTQKPYNKYVTHMFHDQFEDAYPYIPATIACLA